MNHTPASLDPLFFEKLTQENVEASFASIEEKKAKLLATEEKVTIISGCDGISAKSFKKHIKKHGNIITKKCKKGTYLFQPFREKPIPKVSNMSVEECLRKEAEAIENGTPKKFTRTLSIACITDTIVQELLYQTINDTVEDAFQRANVHNVSFAYRNGKTATQAVLCIHRDLKNGYKYAINGDIMSFFDKIDHTLMKEKLDALFLPDSVVNTLLYRFLHVNRITSDDYQAFITERREAENQRKIAYKNKQPLPPKMSKYKTTKRDIGIPQGGVLSGLFANLFLIDFDHYVCTTLKSQFPSTKFQYYRYADDFVLLFQEPEQMEDIFNLLCTFLENEKLTLHPLPPKEPQETNIKVKSSELIDFTVEDASLNFLGYKITPDLLSVKEDNYHKFLSRFSETLDTIVTRTKKQCARKKVLTSEDEKVIEQRFLKAVARETAVHFVGMESVLCKKQFGHCDFCGKRMKPQNWSGYFTHITDTEQLKKLDKDVKRCIRKKYKEVFGREMTNKTYAYLKQPRKNKKAQDGTPQPCADWAKHRNLLSTEHCYYTYKHLEQKHMKEILEHKKREVDNDTEEGQADYYCSCAFESKKYKYKQKDGKVKSGRSIVAKEKKTLADSDKKEAVLL